MNSKTVDADIDDRIRIHAEGAIMTISARDIVQCVRDNQTPVYRPVSEKKSCPNPDCQGGWAPDLRADDLLECPVCKTTWMT